MPALSEFGSLIIDKNAVSLFLTHQENDLKLNFCLLETIIWKLKITGLIYFKLLSREGSRLNRLKTYTTQDLDITQIYAQKDEPIIQPAVAAVSNMNATFCNFNTTLSGTKLGAFSRKIKW